MGTKPSLPLSQYVGKYYNEIYGSGEIKLTGDSLLLSFPNINLKLSHWHFDTFLGKFDYQWWGKAWIPFTINPEGKVDKFDYMGITYKKQND